MDSLFRFFGSGIRMLFETRRKGSLGQTVEDPPCPRKSGNPRQGGEKNGVTKGREDSGNHKLFFFFKSFVCVCP